MQDGRLMDLWEKIFLINIPEKLSELLWNMDLEN